MPTSVPESESSEPSRIERPSEDNPVIPTSDDRCSGVVLDRDECDHPTDSELAEAYAEAEEYGRYLDAKEQLEVLMNKGLPQSKSSHERPYRMDPDTTQNGPVWPE